MNRREQDAIVRDWTVAFGRLILLAYIVSAVVLDWRPADVLEPWLPRVVSFTLNMLTLWIAYRSARRLGTRFGRRQLRVAYGIDPDVSPAHRSKGTLPCLSTPTAPTTPRR